MIGLDNKTSCSRQVAAHLSTNMKGCHRSSVFDVLYSTSHPKRVVPIMHGLLIYNADVFEISVPHIHLSINSLLTVNYVLKLQHSCYW